MHPDMTALERDLADIWDTEKCRRCGCFRSLLTALASDPRIVGQERASSPQPVEERAEDESPTLHSYGDGALLPHERIERYLDEMEAIAYDCLGCDPCIAAQAADRFWQGKPPSLMPEEPARRPAAGESWPPVPGSYIVHDRAGQVAICTLSSSRLVKSPHLALRGVAIVGPLVTENIGIEKLVKNIVSNSNLRFLIICGRESEGHLSGATLVSLCQNGVDESGRVVGDKVGREAHLKNLQPQEIQRFRDQVQIVNLIGYDDVELIATQVEGCEPAEPFAAEALETASARIPARKMKKLMFDPAGYFLIIPDRHSRMIVCEHYASDGRLIHTIEGERASDICDTCVELGLVSKLDHAAYLGRELMRAELALSLGLDYDQDAAR
jgi:tetrahydromethanopterin S-methyltransferase subunit A